MTACPDDILSQRARRKFTRSCGLCQLSTCPNVRLSIPLTRSTVPPFRGTVPPLRGLRSVDRDISGSVEWERENRQYTSKT